jgi:signal recognition particle GTPase
MVTTPWKQKERKATVTKKKKNPFPDHPVGIPTAPQRSRVPRPKNKKKKRIEQDKPIDKDRSLARTHNPLRKNGKQKKQKTKNKNKKEAKKSHKSASQTSRRKKKASIPHTTIDDPPHQLTQSGIKNETCSEIQMHYWKTSRSRRSRSRRKVSSFPRSPCMQLASSLRDRASVSSRLSTHPSLPPSPSFPSPPSMPFIWLSYLAVHPVRRLSRSELAGISQTCFVWHH